MNRDRVHLSAKKRRRALPVVRWMTKAPGCGKRAYPSFDEAIHAALLASRRSGRALRVYLCPTCKLHHLTKRPTWEDRSA